MGHHEFARGKADGIQAVKISERVLLEMSELGVMRVACSHPPLVASPESSAVLELLSVTRGEKIITICNWQQSEVSTAFPDNSNNIH